MNIQPQPNIIFKPFTWWRRGGIIALLLCMGIFGGCVFLVTATNFPTYVVRKVINYQLAGTNVHLIRLDHVTFGRNFLTLEEPEILITPDAHRVLATAVDITFDSGRILKGDFKSIHIRRPHLHINQTPEFPDFHIVRKGVFEAFQKISALDSFEIQDGLFHFGPYAPMGFEGGFVHKTHEGDARLELKMVPSTVPLPEITSESVAPQTIIPSQATLTLTENEGETMVLRVDSPHYRFESKDTTIELQNLKLKIQDPSTLPMDLPIDIPFNMKMSALILDVKNSSFGKLKKPLHIKAKVEPMGGRIEASLKVSGELNKQIHPLLTLEGAYHTLRDDWSKVSKVPASESLAPSHKDTLRGTLTSASINMVEWFDVSPFLAEIHPGLSLDSAIVKLDGGFRGGIVRLNPEMDSIFSGIVPHLTLSLSHVNVSSDLFLVKDMSTVLTLDSLIPMSSKMNQSLTFNEFTLKKITLKEGKILYSLSPGGNLTLNSLIFKALDGHIHARDFKYLSKGDLSKGMMFNADFQNLNVAFLVELADMDSFKADGSLSGEGHFSVDPGGLEIYSVSLKNEKQGIINYKAPAGASQGDAKMVLDALDGFKYNFLKIDVQGVQDKQNDLNAQIHIKGNNPNLLNGYPFEFNIRTSGQLRDVIRSAVNSLAEPKNMEDVRKMMNK